MLQSKLELREENTALHAALKAKMHAEEILKVENDLLRHAVQEQERIVAAYRERVDSARVLVSEARRRLREVTLT